MSGQEDRHKHRSHRNYLSDAEKRKRSKDKQERETAVADKTQKISQFFMQTSTLRDGPSVSQPLGIMITSQVTSDTKERPTIEESGSDVPDV